MTEFKISPPCRDENENPIPPWPVSLTRNSHEVTHVRNMRLLPPAFGCALVLMLALAGCGSGGNDEPTLSMPSSVDDLEELVEQAEDEGSVTFYGTPDEDKVREWVKAFESEYDIDVNIYRAPSSDVFRRFGQEEQAGQHQADLVTMSVPDYISQATEQQWVADYSPQSSEYFAEDMRIAENAYPLYISTNAIAWNTNEVTEQEAQSLRESGYDALLNPKWKGRIGVVSAAAGGPQVSMYGAIAKDPSLGWEYLEDLAAQDPAVFESSVPLISNALSAGEYPVAFPAPDSILAPAITDGSPLKFFYPTPTTSSAHYMFISSNAPHPAAARLFMEWATTVEAQTSIANISGGLVAHSEWQDERPIAREEWYQSPEDINVAWATDAEFQDQVEEITERWLGIFGNA